MHDPVGYPLSSIGAYRFATNDLQAATVRAGSGDATTWMFVARSCIASQLVGQTLSNTTSENGGPSAGRDGGVIPWQSPYPP